MDGLAYRIVLALKLNARSRMAMLYGFAFPLIFLLAFWTIYRHEQPPLLQHMGEVLTITILGGACFGLPTTLVSERERGVWRRYRLTGAPAWSFVAATLSVRIILLLAAAIMQLALAFALGMPAPADGLGLLVAFIAVSSAFLSLGMTLAMTANSVPAVQALGQCVFLPMLIVGGVAVRLSSLPGWAQHVSAFFPGRYAVAALQANIAGDGLKVIGHELTALAVFAVAGGLAADALFRWSPGKRVLSARARAQLGAALALWLVPGLLAEARGHLDARDANARPAPTTSAAAALVGRDWRSVTARDFAMVAFERLPDDAGLIAPMARPGEIASPAIAEQVEAVRARLDAWAPAHELDPVQRVRNLLYVAAVPDVLQMTELERHLPALVLARLRADYGDADLAKLLFWVAMTPEGGDDAAARALAPLGLPTAVGSLEETRARVMVYAFKFLGRVTGAIETDETAPQ